MPTNLFILQNNSLDTLKDYVNYDIISKKDKLKIAQENKLIEIGKQIGNEIGKAIINGYIKDLNNGEAISGATIFIDSPFISTRSDQYGYYSISLPKGRHILKVSSMGKKENKMQLGLYEDGK